MLCCTLDRLGRTISLVAITFLSFACGTTVSSGSRERRAASAQDLQAHMVHMRMHISEISHGSEVTDHTALAIGQACEILVMPLESNSSEQTPCAFRIECGSRVLFSDMRGDATMCYYGRVTSSQRYISRVRYAESTSSGSSQNHHLNNIDMIIAPGGQRGHITLELNSTRLSLVRSSVSHTVQSIPSASLASLSEVQPDGSNLVPGEPLRWLVSGENHALRLSEYPGGLRGARCELLIDSDVLHAYLPSPGPAYDNQSGMARENDTLDDIDAEFGGHCHGSVRPTNNGTLIFSLRVGLQSGMGSHRAIYDFIEVAPPEEAGGRSIVIASGTNRARITPFWVNRPGPEQSVASVTVECSGGLTETRLQELWARLGRMHIRPQNRGSCASAYVAHRLDAFSTSLASFRAEVSGTALTASDARAVLSLALQVYAQASQLQRLLGWIDAAGLRRDIVASMSNARGVLQPAYENWVATVSERLDHAEEGATAEIQQVVRARGIEERQWLAHFPEVFAHEQRLVSGALVSRLVSSCLESVEPEGAEDALRRMADNGDVTVRERRQCTRHRDALWRPIVAAAEDEFRGALRRGDVTAAEIALLDLGRLRGSGTDVPDPQLRRMRTPMARRQEADRRRLQRMRVAIAQHQQEDRRRSATQFDALVSRYRRSMDISMRMCSARRNCNGALLNALGFGRFGRGNTPYPTVIRRLDRGATPANVFCIVERMDPLVVRVMLGLSLDQQDEVREFVRAHPGFYGN